MKKFLLMVFCLGSLIAHDEAPHYLTFPDDGPWFTGPLLAPSGYAVKPGHQNIQFYYYHRNDVGRYNSSWRSVNAPDFYDERLLVEIKTGAIDRVDIEINPQVHIRHTQGQADFGIGDMNVGLNIQLHFSDFKERWPSVKLYLNTNFPIGKFRNLDPSRLNTDAIGSGTWLPGATLVIAKMIRLFEKHYLDMRYAISYNIGTPVHVEGISSYGGGPDTNGTVHPANRFELDAAIQYSLTQNWVFACDLVYQQWGSRGFTGRSGTHLDGSPAVLTAPSLVQFSLAPAIEYNWNKYVGVIAGVWFTFAGRNSPQFVNGIISLNVYR